MSEYFTAISTRLRSKADPKGTAKRSRRTNQVRIQDYSLMCTNRRWQVPSWGNSGKIFWQFVYCNCIKTPSRPIQQGFFLSNADKRQAELSMSKTHGFREGSKF